MTTPVEAALVPWYRKLTEAHEDAVVAVETCDVAERQAAAYFRESQQVLDDVRLSMREVR